jgi:ATP diphosphatase
MLPSRDVARLIEIMKALRTPVSGCSWDLAQTFETIAPYTLEEAYEVVDAVQRKDLVDLREELGDLLLQVVFHAQMAQERGAFDFGGVVEAITTKLIRRHPHVFGDKTDLSPDEVKGQWDAIKAQEKAERRAARAAAGLPDDTPKSLLGGVPDALPALTRAEKLQSKAAKVGFDWGAVGPVLDKIEEELAETRVALAGGDRRDIEEEIGDLLFAMTNLARHAHVDPEDALRRANAKFERRFAYVEARLAESGKSPDQSTLAEMDALWNEVRAADKTTKSDASSPR